MPEDSHTDTLHEKNLLLVGMGRVQRRVHSETHEATIVLATDNEESRNMTLGILRRQSKIQGHLETHRGRSRSRQANKSSQSLLLSSQLFPLSIVTTSEILTPLLAVLVDLGSVVESTALHESEFGDGMWW